MTDFVYRGMPIEKNGVIKYVQPVKGIIAGDGKTYRGLLSTDYRGNRFVYNQVPNDWEIEGISFVTADRQGFLTSDNKQFLVR